MYVIFISVFYFSITFHFKSTYQQIIHQMIGNCLNAPTFHNIIIVFFQNERNHEHIRFLLSIFIIQV